MVKKESKLTELDWVAAQVISFLANVFFTIPLVLILVNLSEIREDWQSSVAILLFGLVPSILVYFKELYKDKRLFYPSVDLSRKEREPVFMTIVFALVLCIGIISRINQDSFWMYILMNLIIFFGAAYLLDKYIDKVSMHSGAITFITFYLCDKVALEFAFLLVVMPIIYWARIKLHKHTWLQLMIGIVMGMAVGLLSWSY